LEKSKKTGWLDDVEDLQTRVFSKHDLKGEEKKRKVVVDEQQKTRKRKSSGVSESPVLKKFEEVKSPIGRSPVTPGPKVVDLEVIFGGIDRGNFRE
jgi:hypothetical protein